MTLAPRGPRLSAPQQHELADWFAEGLRPREIATRIAEKRAAGDNWPDVSERTIYRWLSGLDDKIQEALRSREDYYHISYVTTARNIEVYIEKWLDLADKLEATIMDPGPQGNYPTLPHYIATLKHIGAIMGHRVRSQGPLNVTPGRGQMPGGRNAPRLASLRGMSLEELKALRDRLPNPGPSPVIDAQAED